MSMTTIRYFFEKSLQCTFDAIAADPELAKEIQSKLVELGLLKEVAEGFGDEAKQGLTKFQESQNIPEENFIGRRTSSALMTAEKPATEATPESVAPPITQNQAAPVGSVPPEQRGNESKKSKPVVESNS